MANPFKDGGSLNIPTQAAADEMKKSGSQDYNDFLFYQKYGLPRSEWEAEQGTVGPLEGYQTGETRRNILDMFPDKYRSKAREFIGGDPNQAMGLGYADATFIPGILDAYDGWNASKDIASKNRQAKKNVEDQLISEGYDPASKDFYAEYQRRLPETESSAEPMIDVVFGALSGLGISQAKNTIQFLKNFGLKHLGAR
jgi:hypothetical protein